MAAPIGKTLHHGGHGGAREVKRRRTGLLNSNEYSVFGVPAMPPNRYDLMFDSKSQRKPQP
jgi:hypothetical protein